MTPFEVLTFASGIIMCVLGVCTFVVGLTTRAKSDGILTNKVDTALKGIAEIQETLKEQRDWREDIGTKFAVLEQDVKKLKEDIDEINIKLMGSMGGM